jgi:hypothetical protein
VVLGLRSRLGQVHSGGFGRSTLGLELLPQGLEIGDEFLLHELVIVCLLGRLAFEPTPLGRESMALVLQVCRLVLQLPVFAPEIVDLSLRRRQALLEHRDATAPVERRRADRGAGAVADRWHGQAVGGERQRRPRGSGPVKALSVDTTRWLCHWLAIAGLTEGPLFRSTPRSNQPDPPASPRGASGAGCPASDC